MSIWKIDGATEDSKGRKNEAEFDINLIVRGDHWGVQLDVEITPLYCMNCHQQLDGFFKFGDSRYGQIGTVKCNHCGADINCVDDDNIRERLMTYTGKSEFILVYSELYELDNEIWKVMKGKLGYDIIKKYQGETISLRKVIEEICEEYQIEPSSLEACTTATSDKISRLPEVVNKWRSLRKYIMGLEDKPEKALSKGPRGLLSLLGDMMFKNGGR